MAGTLAVFGGAKACMTGGSDLSPGPYGGETSGGLTGGSRRRRLHRTKGKARRARVRSSSAGGSRKRKGSRKSKRSRKSKKSKGSRKH